MTLFDKSLSSKSINFIDNNVKPIPNLLEKENNKNGYQNFKNRFNNVDGNEALKILSNNLDTNNNSKITNYKSKDDPVLEEMQRQSQV